MTDWTPREREVLRLLCKDGAANSDIARALYLSPKTVKSHMTSAMLKAGVRNRTHLALVARDQLEEAS